MTISSLRLNVLCNFEQCESVRPFVTAGIGCEKTDIQRYGDRSDVGFNAGAGLRWFLSPNFNLRFDGRFVRTNLGGDINEAQENLEATIGLGWALGGGCREVAAVAAARPTPDIDSDGDGVYDRFDRCPDTPRGVKVDRSGCPPAAAKPPVVQTLQERKAVVLEGVEFDHDKDVLRSESATTLDEVAASLKD
jgi:OOP family OmpA-OmpF porin